MNGKFEGSARRIGNVTSAVAIGAAIVMIASAAFTSAASAAQTCEGLKHAINADGVYLYRFKDKREPTLPLYVRYTTDETKCGSGDILEQRLVPDLENCYVPTCVIGEGEDDR